MSRRPGYTPGRRRCVTPAGVSRGLPIKFPSDAEVIADDAARFQAFSPEEQVRTLDEMVRLYYVLADHADHPVAIARFADEDEWRGREAVVEFAVRHARP